MSSAADILGAEGAAGSPDVIRSTATQFQDVATTAATIKSHLASLDGVQWTGKAAELYRAKQDAELPAELDKLSSSFDKAASALSGYAPKLESIIDRAAKLAQQRETANATLASARTKESSARTTLRDATVARLVTIEPTARAKADIAVTHATRAATAAGSARSSAESAVATIEKNATALRDELKQCADGCKKGLEAASDAGIKSDFFSWADRHVVHGVPGAVVGGIVHTVTEYIARSFELIGDAALLLADPDSLERRLAFADAYSRWVDAAKPILTAAVIALLVVTAAVIVVAQPETIAAVLPALTIADRVVAGVGTGLDGTKLVADGYLAEHGQRTQAQVDADVAQLGLGLIRIPGAGKATGAGKIATSLDKVIKKGSYQSKTWLRTQITRFETDLQIRTLQEATLEGGKEVIDSVMSLFGPEQTTRDLPAYPPNQTLCQGSSAQIRARVASTNVALVAA